MENGSDVIALATRVAHGPSRIEYSSSAALPKLAWIATLDSEQARLSVLHGRAVECRPSFMVEGVWDGPFEAGAFHNGAHLFGSGIRLDRGAVYFVPSAALVDRLVYCRDGGKLLVSNSVVALLAATGARLDPSHDYLIEARALLAGVDGYDTAFHVLHPSIERFHQIFHKVLAVRDGAITLERTIAVREFDSFHDYCTTLRESLAAICANAKDPARRTPLMTFGTLSTGYDSTAVTTLVKDLGVKRYFTYVGAWGATHDRPEYETGPIAAALNIEVIRIQSPRTPDPEDELLLRAASPLGHQIPLLAMANYVERNAEAAAVFTGFHGDVVWDVDAADEFVSEGIIRKGHGGLDLSELRLKSGFIGVAAPFLYAASIRSIVAVSRSTEMAPWRLGTTYDRPICRRIVEGAGVPRDRFGFLKGGIQGGAGTRPVGAELRTRYFEYLSRNVLPLPLLYARLGLDRETMRLLGGAGRIAKRRLHLKGIGAALLEQFWRFHDGYSWYGSRNYCCTLHLWAVMELVEKLHERGIGAPSAAKAPVVVARSAAIN